MNVRLALIWSDMLAGFNDREGPGVAAEVAATGAANLRAKEPVVAALLEMAAGLLGPRGAGLAPPHGVRTLASIVNFEQPMYFVTLTRRDFRRAAEERRGGGR